MKFTNDRKPSLCIYTNGVIQSSDDKQMESSLKKELEETKSALKLQTIRCRQLVAAFTRKLQEKELELRASKDLKDQQLSRLLRALLILESRLKKEQKLIRQQLEEKDLIIERQEREIIRYKRLEAHNKWASMESLGSETDRDSDTRKWSTSDVDRPNVTGEERLDNLCRRLSDPLRTRTFRSEDECENILDEDDDIDGGRDGNEDDDEPKKKDNTYKDNPVLESVNQILLRDEEELLNPVQPVDLNEKGSTPEGMEGSEWYETDGSLIVPEERTETGAWCISVVEEEIEPESKDAKKDFHWSREKSSSPGKSQHLEEKAVLEMSKKNLTIAQARLDFEEIDAKSCDGTKSTASYQEILPVTRSPAYQPVRSLQKPPALPPKPARLLKPQQIHQQNRENQNAVKTAEKVKLTQASSNPLNQSSTRHRHPESKVQPKSTKRTPLDKQPQQSLKKKEPTSPIAPNCHAIKIGTSVSSLITGSSRDTIVTELNREVPADDSRVSQVVRQFEVMTKQEIATQPPPQVDGDDGNDLRKNFEEFKLEESYVESVIEGDDVGRHDGDGAETLVNHYATLSVATGQQGQQHQQALPPLPPLPKNPPPSLDADNKVYETFLETTGLSQKSILTPSRMLSNHRSCLKPKDVKHRNRVKAAAAIEKCGISSIGGSTVKYWTEPFL